MTSTAENEGLAFIQDSLNNKADSAEYVDSVSSNHEPSAEYDATVASNHESSADEQEEDDDPEADGILEQRQYDTMNQLREAAIRYAKKHKFAVATQRSNKTSIRLVCKHAGNYRQALSKTNVMREPHKKGTRTKKSQRIECPFEIVGGCFADRWVITKIHIDHNHEMAKDITVYAQHRKITPELKKEITKMIDEKLKNTQILDILMERGHKNIIIRDIANVRTVRNRELAKLKQQRLEAEFDAEAAEAEAAAIAAEKEALAITAAEEAEHEEEEEEEEEEDSRRKKRKTDTK